MAAEGISALATMEEPHWQNIKYPPIDYSGDSLLLGTETKTTAQRFIASRSGTAEDVR